MSVLYFNPYTVRFVHNRRTNSEETLVTANVWYQQRQSSTNFVFNYYYFEPFIPTSARADGVVLDKFPKFTAKTEMGANTTKSIMVPFTTDETLLVRAEAKIHLDIPARTNLHNKKLLIFITDWNIHLQLLTMVPPRRNVYHPHLQ